jgi:hypothetical protein
MANDDPQETTETQQARACEGFGAVSPTRARRFQLRRIAGRLDGRLSGHRVGAVGGLTAFSRSFELHGMIMVKLKDKVTGKVKQVVAEITGDGKLHQEGKEQEEKAKEKPNELNPLGDLNQLT